MANFDDTKNGNGEHTNSPMITNSKLEIGDDFLKLLQDNAFNGMDKGDVTYHIAKNKIPDDLDDRTDYFEFIHWLASKFDNYWEIDKNIKNRLWEFYVNECTKGTIGDLDEYKEPCEENTKKTCLDAFYKPYLDAQEAKDIYDVIDKEYSPIPIPARRDIDNPDELCRTEEFTIIQHSIGNDEEFVTVSPSKISTVERTPSSMSCIYHELFNRKDYGWEDLAENEIDLMVGKIAQCNGNYGVTCEDEAERRNSKTKTKTFEENCYLLLYSKIVRQKGIAMATPDLNETYTTPCLSNLNLAEPETNDNVKTKISKELLMELRNHAYDGAEANDAVDHITRFLQIINLVKIPNVNTEQLCVFTFPYSLSGGARRWWMHEGNYKITSWVKFMHWLNSKFKNPWKLNTATKNALWNFWEKGYDNDTLIYDEESRDDESYELDHQDTNPFFDP
ncbi:hypothetical protein Tco_1243844 [Tanacetum coccineum]